MTRAEHIELEKQVEKAFDLYRVENGSRWEDKYPVTIEQVLRWMREHRPG